MWLTQRRVEAMAQAALDFGLSATAGAMKGKTVTIGQGINVIRSGVDYVTRAAPPKVVAAADGANGIANRVFRKLDLEADGTLANTLVPALEAVNRDIPAAIARGRTR
jgi:hypothetical protein